MLIVILSQGMEKIVKEVFQHVDVIGPRVQRGMFDLIGPNGEMILPQVWDQVIEPGWQITMAMWSVDVANVEKEMKSKKTSGGPFPNWMFGELPKKKRGSQ